MPIFERLSPERVNLNLAASTKDEVLEELTNLLAIDAKARRILIATLKKREALGSTGVGNGIAIPHCRSLVVDRMSLAVGRSANGVDFGAHDKKKVYYFFLIVAPPQDAANQYLITLGKIAQVTREMTKQGGYPDIDDAVAFLKYLSEVEAKIA
jgi:PTS system nitrogen regulatory IIA component